MEDVGDLLPILESLECKSGEIAFSKHGGNLAIFEAEPEDEGGVGLIVDLMRAEEAHHNLHAHTGRWPDADGNHGVAFEALFAVMRKDCAFLGPSLHIAAEIQDSMATVPEFGFEPF